MVGLRACARNSGVDKMTFKRRADSCGAVNRLGRPTALPKIVEDKLAQKLLELADAAMDFTPSQAQLYARGIAKKLKLEIGTWQASKA